MSRNYIVTGGTGFIGSSLVRRLVRDGHNVKVVDNDLRGSRKRLEDVIDDIELVIADVRDIDAMKYAARGVDSILHLAALNGTENFYNRPELVLDVGIKGMLAMLEAAKENNIEEFVLASSSEVYQTPPVIPTPENVPLTIPEPWNPRYSYGGSKLISEVMLANYNRDVFKKAIIFRPHNVYGPDMGWEHVIPQLVTQARTRVDRTPSGPIQFKIQGDGNQTRSFIHINDFIDGLITVINKGQNRNVYHIGTRDEITIRTLVNIIFDSFNRQAELISTPIPKGGTLRRCPDISKIVELGFDAKVSIRDGVPEVVSWYVNQADDAKLEQIV